MMVYLDVLLIFWANFMFWIMVLYKNGNSGIQAIDVFVDRLSIRERFQLRVTVICLSTYFASRIWIAVMY
jgi:hypothetical protein